MFVHLLRFLYCLVDFFIRTIFCVFCFSFLKLFSRESRFLGISISWIFPDPLSNPCTCARDEFSLLRC